MTSTEDIYVDDCIEMYLWSSDYNPKMSKHCGRFDVLSKTTIVDARMLGVLENHRICECPQPFAFTPREKIDNIMERHQRAWSTLKEREEKRRTWKLIGSGGYKNFSAKPRERNVEYIRIRIVANRDTYKEEDARRVMCEFFERWCPVVAKLGIINLPFIVELCWRNPTTGAIVSTQDAEDEDDLDKWFALMCEEHVADGGVLDDETLAKFQKRRERHRRRMQEREEEALRKRRERGVMLSLAELEERRRAYLRVFDQLERCNEAVGGEHFVDCLRRHMANEDLVALLVDTPQRFQRLVADVWFPDIERQVEGMSYVDTARPTVRRTIDIVRKVRMLHACMLPSSPTPECLLQAFIDFWDRLVRQCRLLFASCGGDDAVDAFVLALLGGDHRPASLSLSFDDCFNSPPAAV